MRSDSAMDGDEANLTLTSKQREQITKLKERVADVLQPYHSDYWLERFLRARKFDLRKTESMFRKDVKWRTENQVPTMHQKLEEPEVLKHYVVGGTLGFAKDGRPVYLDPTGNTDFRGLLHSATASDIMKCFIKRLESLQNSVIEQTKKLKRQIEGIYYIVDLENLGHHHLWKPGVQLYTQVVSMCEHHYPELLHRVFVVRAPRLFPLAYSIVKPFLHEHTRNKVFIFRDDFADELLKYMDAAILPQYWGGTLTEDGNPMCPTTVILGGTVPRNFYLTGRDLSVDPAQMTTKEIARGGALQLMYNVAQCNSVLSYEFRTRDHDISFGVKKIGRDGSKTVIMKSQRYNCHLVPETGQLILEEPGTYNVKFDNGYSWARTKKLSYWIEFLEPSNSDDTQSVKDESEESEEEFVQASEG